MKATEKRPAKLISVLSLVTAATVIIGITLLNVWGAGGNEPTTFVGDEPWYVESQSRYKWQKIFGKIYVPVTIFYELGYEIPDKLKIGHHRVAVGHKIYFVFNGGQ